MDHVIDTLRGRAFNRNSRGFIFFLSHRKDVLKDCCILGLYYCVDSNV
uniref:Uncharacterized protein n=1 Tax=Arundo donax TaxID=35708 RepID=A0A0A9BF47_ARUDO